MNTSDSYQPIRELLERVRARWRTIRLFQAMVRAALAASAVLIISLIVAQWAARSPFALAALAVASLLLGLGAMAWAFAPLRDPPSNARLARFIEVRKSGRSRFGHEISLEQQDADGCARFEPVGALGHDKEAIGARKRGQIP